jgi:hypothetical protein
MIDVADAKPMELAIAKLDLRAGDVLVIKVDRPVDAELAQRIRDYAKIVLPEGVKTLVIDHKTNISTVQEDRGELRTLVEQLREQTRRHTAEIEALNRQLRPF